MSSMYLKFMSERKIYIYIYMPIGKKKNNLFEFLNLMKCQNEDEFRTVDKLCASIKKEHRKYIILVSAPWK